MNERMKNTLKIMVPLLLWFSGVTVGYTQEPDSEWQKQFQQVRELYKQGEFADAVAPAVQALEIAEQDETPDPIRTALCLNTLGLLYDKLGEYEKAEPLYLRSLSIREKSLEPNDPAIVNVLDHLAGVYEAVRDYAGAERMYRRLLAIHEAADDPLEVAIDLSFLGALYEQHADYTKAEPLYRRSLELREKTFGPDDPKVALGLNQLAENYRHQGDYEKAKPLYERSLAIVEAVLGPEHPDVATSLSNLAFVYEEAGEYAKAEPLYRRALAIDEKVFGPDHLYVITDLKSLLSIYIDMEDEENVELLHKRLGGINAKVEMGSVPESEGLYLPADLDRILKYPEDLPAMVLFMAAAEAFEKERLEDSGFLFYAAQLRRRFDEKCFTAIGQGGNSPHLALAAMSQQLGYTINPAVMSEPKVFAKVIERLKVWTPKASKDHDPGYSFSDRLTEEAAHKAAEPHRADFLRGMSDMVTLLNDDEYFAASNVLRAYNLGPRDERPTKEEYDEATATMRRVEEAKGLRGFFDEQ